MMTDFSISPLIRFTLLSFYLSLTLPLPFLAEVTHTLIPSALLWVGIAGGFVFLYGGLSEKVITTDEGISVGYPIWFPPFIRRGWFLSWDEITALKCRSTGQGGLVYYFTVKDGKRAYLLPMRVAGFSRLVNVIQSQTAINTSDIRPLSQPWMYVMLLLCTLSLGLMDIWVVFVGAKLV